MQEVQAKPKKEPPSPPIVRLPPENTKLLYTPLSPQTKPVSKRNLRLLKRVPTRKMKHPRPLSFKNQRLPRLSLSSKRTNQMNRQSAKIQYPKTSQFILLRIYQRKWERTQWLRIPFGVVMLRKDQFRCYSIQRTNLRKLEARVQQTSQQLQNHPGIALPQGKIHYHHPEWLKTFRRSIERQDGLEVLLEYRDES